MVIEQSSMNIKKSGFFKMTPICINNTLEPLSEILTSSTKGILRNFLPCLFQGSSKILQIVMGWRTGFFFQNTPHTEIHRIEIGQRWWPQIFGLEWRKVLFAPLLHLLWCVRRRAVLLEGEGLNFELFLHRCEGRG